MRKLVVNLVLHQWCWSCRHAHNTGTNLMREFELTLAPFYNDGTGLKEPETLRKFVEYAMANCRNVVHLASAIKAIAEIVACFSAVEMQYATQLMDKYYATRSLEGSRSTARIGDDPNQ